jgi:hypothetical protein
LQHLDLSGCTQITDGGLVHLQQLPLQHLILSWSTCSSFYCST